MTLTLPQAVEPFLSDDVEWSQPAVYAIVLKRPEDVAQAWDSVFENRPPYFTDLQEADTVVYVGAAKNLMHRLEDHSNGNVRKSALLRICEIDHLRNVWWFDSADRAFERESGFAIALQNEHADYYVHQR